jgi:hypothetical protein
VLERLRGEQIPSPDPEIDDLATRTTMTEEAQAIFFATSPQLRARAGFTLSCPTKERRQILGCYRNGKIFILRVDRPELAPVMEVTAAHEMLHAAYETLSRAERRRISGLAAAFYTASDDPELIDLVGRYPESDRLNELHSLLATQVDDLPAELEQHYRQYFLDRSRVVAAHRASDLVFDRIEARHAQLLGEIHALAARIDQLLAQQAAAVEEARRLSSQIDALRGQNRIDESNRLVPLQNAAADRATTLQAQIVLLTNDHNARVREINELVFRQDELVQSLSSD